jgi:hypothetical protein
MVTVIQCIQSTFVFSYVHKFHSLLKLQPVTVVERSKACTVFAHSKAGTLGSNPTQGMDV